MGDEWADEVDDPEPATAIGAQAAAKQTPSSSSAQQPAQGQQQNQKEQAEPKLKQRPKLSPFGNAKPREEVLAQREGKREQDVIRQEAQTFNPKLSLSKQQREQKEALEEEIESLKSQCQAESSSSKVCCSPCRSSFLF